MPDNVRTKINIVIHISKGTENYFCKPQIQMCFVNFLYYVNTILDFVQSNVIFTETSKKNPELKLRVHR